MSVSSAMGVGPRRHSTAEPAWAPTARPPASGTAPGRRGPREHFTRPAIDPLFTSLAQVYGQRVVGIVLSGCGADGARGLIAIKRAGGITISQDPAESPSSWMPINAIMHDDVDGVLTIDEIAEVLQAVVSGESIEVLGQRA